MTNADQYEVIGGGFTEPLLAAAAITTGDRILDIGCGYGATTRAAALRSGSGLALGNDVNPAMVAAARESSAGIPNVTFEAGDAQIHPFPDGGFDVAVSRFGVMFFADPVAAFANIGRALRPGGRLAIAAVGRPEDNDLPALLASAIPGADNVHALSDPAYLTAVLDDAGFTEITVSPVATTITLAGGPEQAAGFLSEWGAFRDFLAPERHATVIAALARAAQPFRTGRGIRLRSSAWLAGATRPPSHHPRMP
ncbi:class I SAM-dependent methyltransferase [Actinoplanes campanulatus]|nr:methyltransferase domain-containing protein [Actinoplanes campanulatus]